MGNDMSKSSYCLLLVILILAIFLRRGGCSGDDGGQPPLADTNVVPVVVPDYVVPKTTTNIIYDDYKSSVELSKKQGKKLVLIFSADWCVYCNDLKLNLESIKKIQNFIVCIIDIDKDKETPSKFKIKNLPTSVVLDSQDKELARFVGYRKNKYEIWIDSM